MIRWLCAARSCVTVVAARTSLLSDILIRGLSRCGRGSRGRVRVCGHAWRLRRLTHPAIRSRWSRHAVSAAATAAAPTTAAATRSAGGRRLTQRLENFCGRPEAQRGVRHAQRVVAPRDFDVHVGRHAGLQFQLRIRHVNHRVVGDDVLHRLRLEPHLRHGADEILRGVCVHTKMHDLARADPADVGFVQARDDLHLRQVGREDEQRGRRHARRDGLSHVDVARNHKTVDRRGDDRVLEIHLILLERGLGLRHGRLLRFQLRVRGLHRHLRRLEIDLRHKLLVVQLLRALQLRLRVVQRHAQAIEIGLRAKQVRARLFDLCLEQRGIQPGNDLPFVHE